MTTVVVPTSSFRDGQETLFSSFRTSRTNSTPLLMRSLILSKNSFIDRQSCGAPPLKDLAGQEGLEPPTCGFGDRRSTNSSYWPVSEIGHDSCRIMIRKKHHPSKRIIWFHDVPYEFCKCDRISSIPISQLSSSCFW